jgi:3-hydroxyisobutyrate dehydrogenase-like beta-hydroxyacid dehydrogenase
MAKVAVLGLGIMGHAMARNFLAGGHEVTVWNRSPGRSDDLAKEGAAVATTPAEAASGADVVFEVTADDASSRAVWLDPEAGALAGATPGAVLVTSATLSPGWVASLAEACEGRGHTFFDMPLTGGRVGAEAGELVMLVGGDPQALRELRPTLDAVAKDVKHFGPVGAGTRFKLILNALQAVHLAGFGEAMRLAVAAGLDTGAVGQALVERPGGIVTQMGHAAYPERPERVSFPLQWATKDLNYAAAMAGDVPHPLLAATRDLFERTVEAGHGPHDWTAVIEPAGDQGE